MTGYMKEVIFTRVVGHEDIEGGDRWKDACQCWICEKWDKSIIEFGREDEDIMRENINQLEELKVAIKERLNVKNLIQTEKAFSSNAFPPMSRSDQLP